MNVAHCVLENDKKARLKCHHCKDNLVKLNQKGEYNLQILLNWTLVSKWQTKVCVAQD